MGMDLVAVDDGEIVGIAKMGEGVSGGNEAVLVV